MLDIRHLRAFHSVCKNMNMTKASVELYISQPAISKTISEIESYYGMLLFERRNKALLLTPDGKRLYEYADMILTLMQQMDRSMLEDPQKETLHIGASITVGTSILSDIIAAYRLKAPNVQVTVTVDNTDVIERALLESKLDLAIVEGDIANRAIQTESVGDTEVVLVVNGTHPLYSKERVSLDDLRDMDFIVREEGSQTRSRFSQAMEEASIHWYAAWSCHNTQTIKNAVDAGLGIGVLSKLSVRKRLRSGKLRALPVFPQPLTMRIHIAYRKNQYFSQALDEFKTFLIQQFHVMEMDGYSKR